MTDCAASHTSLESQATYQFWLSCCSAASSTLRWAVSRSAVPGIVAKTHRNGETKNKERSIDIKKILKVETGTGQFPGSNGTKGQLSSLLVKFKSLANAAHVLKTVACVLAGCCEQVAYLYRKSALISLQYCNMYTRLHETLLLGLLGKMPLLLLETDSRIHRLSFWICSLAMNIKPTAGIISLLTFLWP